MNTPRFPIFKITLGENWRFGFINLHDKTIDMMPTIDRNDMTNPISRINNEFIDSIYRGFGQPLPDSVKR